MSNGNVDQVSASANPQVQMNDAFTAFKPAGLFGYRGSTTAGLTLGLYGGLSFYGGTFTNNADQTATLTASATNYIEATIATPPVVSVNQTAFTAGRRPLYKIVTGANSFNPLTDMTDYRILIPEFAPGPATDSTLTLAAGTVTASTPILTRTEEWNSGGTIFIGSTTNITATASAAASIVEQWQVNASNIMALRKDGRLTLAADLLATTAQLSSLTASVAVFTDGSKNLVSNTISGTGSVAMTASPTFTGTVTAAAITASGAINANLGARFAGGFTPASGAGLEVIYSGGIAQLIAYDRTGAAFLPLSVFGTPINFLPNGTQTLGLTANAVAVTGTIAASGVITATGGIVSGNSVSALNNTTGNNALRIGVGVNQAGNAGAGWEFQHTTSTSTSSAAAYDRTGSAYQNMAFDALSHSFKVSGSAVLGVSSGAATVTGTLGSSGLNTITDVGNTSAFKFMSFVSNGAEAGNIIRVGTTSVVTFTTTSDGALKNIFGDSNINAAHSRTMGYRMRDYEWKSDRGVHWDGPIAQEIYAVNEHPSLVTPGNGAVPWSVNMSGFIPDLIMTAQHQARQIEELRAVVFH